MTDERDYEKTPGPAEGTPGESPEPALPEEGAEAPGQAPGRAEEQKAENERLLDRMMRLQAEYENYRKRLMREREEWSFRAIQGLVLDLLPVIDSFDRALAAASSATDAESVREGMQLVQKQLLDAFAAHEIQPIEAEGQAFDPNLHEAFASRPAAEGETPGTLVEEFTRGYRMKDRVVRPTRGIVAVPPESAADEERAEESDDADL